MISFAQIQQRVARNLQVLGASKYTDVQIANFIQQIYSDIWHLEEFPDTLDFFTVTLKAGSKEFTIPKQVAWVIRAYTSQFGDKIRITDVPTFGDNNLAFTTQGPILYNFTPIRLTSLLVQPTSSQTLKLQSTGAADKTNIFIKGRNGAGEQISEVIALNGNAIVNTVNAYASVEVLGKNEVTLGTVIVLDVTGLITLATMGRFETRPMYQVYRCSGSPAIDTDFQIIGKKAFQGFVDTMDFPAWEMDNALIYGATSLAWSEDRNEGEGLNYHQRYEIALADMRIRLLNESGEARLLLPVGRA